MTGKRPRALTRTAGLSQSQLGSGNLSQEFSPLPENPREKLKPTIKEPSCAPCVVIGFDPKPSTRCLNSSDCGILSASAPCSPSHQDKGSSPRSVLNSLFSRVKPTEPGGVGLGILLRVPLPRQLSEEIKISIMERPIESDHIVIPIRDDFSAFTHSRTYSHPIPTPGMSACHTSNEAPKQVVDKQVAVGAGRKCPQQPAVRPVVGWLEQDLLKVDLRDTFLLSPARSLTGDNVAAALATSTHFLDECTFCKRRLLEDKDIFMYRGDEAFCSVECRSQQMLMDERSKNCSSSALKRGPVAPSRRSCVAPASSVVAA